MGPSSASHEDHLSCGATPTSTWTHMAPPRIRATSVQCPHSRGLVCLSHVALSHPRGSHAMSARDSCGKINPFLPFLKTIKSIKIKINSRKIQTNSKNLEINIFKSITPFNIKFSPLAHNYIHLISCHLKYKLKEGYKMNLK